MFVVIGALDPGASPERIDGTSLKSFPNLGLVQMQNVGLHSMLGAPQELSSIIADFLEGRKGAEEMI